LGLALYVCWSVFLLTDLMCRNVGSIFRKGKSNDKDYWNKYGGELTKKKRKGFEEKWEKKGGQISLNKEIIRKYSHCVNLAIIDDRLGEEFEQRIE